MNRPPAHANIGIPSEDVERAAKIIESAFSAELSTFVPSPEKRRRLLAAGVNRSMLIGAWDNNELIGVAGIRGAEASALDRTSLSTLRRELGTGAVRAWLGLRLLHAPLDPGTIQLEFLAVDEDARGRGVGSSLLEAAAAHTCSVGAKRIQLFVNDRNQEANRLYRQHGFVPEPSASLPRLNRLLGTNLGLKMTKETLCMTS